jgi:hypothetical protein
MSNAGVTYHAECRNLYYAETSSVMQNYLGKLSAILRITKLCRIEEYPKTWITVLCNAKLSVEMRDLPVKCRTILCLEDYRISCG